MKTLTKCLHPYSWSRFGTLTFYCRRAGNAQFVHEGESVKSTFKKKLRIVCFLSLLVSCCSDLGRAQQSCQFPPTFNDPASQDGILGLMEIPCAWTITNGNEHIAVAVFDDYLDGSHSDLINKVVEIVNYGECNPGEADEHHGIMCLGAVTGVRNNDICIAGSGGDTKVAAFCGAANDSRLQDAYDRGYRIMSISHWSDSGITKAKLQELTDGGATVLLAGLCLYHSASDPDGKHSVPGVIHVGRALQNRSFWNYDVGCSGTVNQNMDVLVITEALWRIADGNSCEPAGGGTSIGTPLLAGVVALMRAVNPCLSPQDIEEILVETADPIPPNATILNTRAGVINAYSAVLSAKNFVGIDQTWGAGGGGATIKNGYVSGNLNIFTGGDVVVEGNVYFGSESTVTIQPNAKLIVEGSLNFGENSRVIVKRGGQLIVDGGKLTRSYCADSWRGVIVEGNTTKAQQLPDDPTDDLKCGIVDLRNGAVIEYAVIAVSMNPTHLQWPNYEYYGGLVMARDATFANNTRAVEFMKYRKFEDQSSFSNVSFEGSGKFITTHWENHGVTFNNCQFSEYEHQAILTWDAAVEVVNGCTFDNAGHTQNDQASMHLYHTFPNPYASVIGDETGEPNVFSGGFYHIYTTSADNKVPVLVKNNMFIGGFAGVTFDGISNQVIENNDFIGQIHSNRIIANGQHFNQTLDNYYSEAGVGAFVWFDNSRYEFSTNCFTYTIVKDFRLDEGRIAGDIGSIEIAASNCFTTGTPKGIQLSGGAEVFRYHILQGTPSSSCQRPSYTGNVINSLAEHPLECGSTSSAGPINVDWIQCIIPSDPDDIEDAIFALTIELNALETDLDKETYLSAEWLEIKFQITEVERCIQQMNLSLIRVRGEADEMIELISFFSNHEFFYKVQVYGMFVHSENYEGARTYLNSLTTIDEEQTDLVFVQNLNLDRMQDREYVLSTADSTQLRAIGMKKLPYAGYARSLYFVLTGKKLSLYLPEEEGLEPRSLQEVKEDKFALTGYPNPVRNEYSIESSVATSDELLISLFDLNGLRLIEMKMPVASISTKLNLSALIPGIYIVSVRKSSSGEIVFKSKVIKTE